MRADCTAGMSYVGASAMEWVSLTWVPPLVLPEKDQNTWLFGYLPLVALMKLNVMTLVAAGKAAVLPQKLAGGLPSALGLMCTRAALETALPEVLPTTTVSESLASVEASAPE